MTEDIIKTTIGALLHDIGKLVQRAGDVSGTHSVIGESYLKELGFQDDDILDCVRYHHGKDLQNSTQPSPHAYITYIADNIASATQRRDLPDEDAQAGWNPKMPLQSVFSLLREPSKAYYYRPVTLDSKEGINYPQAEAPDFEVSFYKAILDRFSDNIKGYELTHAYINSLIELAEATLSYVPSSTNTQEVADISLYDHMKLTAAVASCIYCYLDEKGIDDYKNTLYKRAEEFYNEDFAMIYSADISGIQNFIYTIHSEGALKSLRARSFYLELFTENLIDDILDNIGLTRANLLYSGGGHFYLLLPNTNAIKDKLKAVLSDTNRWLLNRFRTDLYIADGYCECSSNKLQNIPKGSYGEIFKKVSLTISAKKLHRYTADDLISLNNKHHEGRECRVCKSVEVFDGHECNLCAALITLSSSISKKYDADDDDIFFVITDISNATSVSVPISPAKVAIAAKKRKLSDMLSDNASIVRYYGKNVYYGGTKLSTKLWVGDYCKEKELSKYAEHAEGIKRIGVLRMDVDDLGVAFTSGFRNADTEEKYNTLSRTAVFSRHLSLFFKREVNTLLCDNDSDITVIYSGGDDMFLIGAWNDIMDAAIQINDAFCKYTQGKLTLSAGIGMYPGKYPVHVMARETGKLENHSKQERENGEKKNAITVFSPQLRFSWDELKNKIIGEKLALLEDFFRVSNEKGNAFLYQMLSYIQGVETEESEGVAKISLARYAYMLSRVEPECGDEEKKQRFKVFSRQMYEWISKKDDRKQLMTAIYLYVYSRRGEA